MSNHETYAPKEQVGDAPSSETRLVLVVDDMEASVLVLAAHLQIRGYRTVTAMSGESALHKAAVAQPDLILLDVNMPGMDGLEVCRRLRRDPNTAGIPVVLITANSRAEDVAEGFDSGADDYLIKPYSEIEMHARVQSVLRLYDVQRRLDELNRDLEQKVADQVAALERTNRLTRFFSPQIVETILAENAEDKLSDHRCNITVVFVDLRHFTAYAQTALPEDVINTLREFHCVVGPIIFEHRGTLERFAGDGMMIFLGDPEPMDDHPTQAARMCLEIRRAVNRLQQEWATRGLELGIGIGMATGDAVVGTVGFEGRMDYAAIGSVTNLAARLCDCAEDGEILACETVVARVGGEVQVTSCGRVALKGFSDPQAVFKLD